MSGAWRDRSTTQHFEIAREFRWTCARRQPELSIIGEHSLVPACASLLITNLTISLQFFFENNTKDWKSHAKTTFFSSRVIDGVTTGQQTNLKKQRSSSNRDE